MQEFCCFIVFLCQYIHSFIFPEMAGEGGATAPLATPLNPPLIMNFVIMLEAYLGLLHYC